MRHLRLVSAADAAAAIPPAAPGEPRVLPAQRRPDASDAPAAVPGARGAGDGTEDGLEDDLPLLYVPARLMLALAGRCSCADCCTAYAEHRPEPHDPRRCRPHLRAI